MEINRVEGKLGNKTVAPLFEDKGVTFCILPPKQFALTSNDDHFVFCV